LPKHSDLRRRLRRTGRRASDPCSGQEALLHLHGPRGARPFRAAPGDPACADRAR